MQAKKTSDAKAILLSDGLPRFARRYHTHSQAAGRNDSRTVLFNAVMPQRSPNSNQGSQPSRSSRVRASHKSVASRRADRLVSQTHFVHQYITLGSRAHAHAAPTATLSEKMRRAMRNIGTQVSAEKALLIVNSTLAEALE